MKVLYNNYVTNYHDKMSRLFFMITILGKHTTWELRNIEKNSLLQDIIASLKINFIFKVQSHLNLFYSRYKDRENPNGFDQYVNNNINLINNRICLRVEQ